MPRSTKWRFRHDLRCDRYRTKQQPKSNKSYHL
jgi:hypothetical protein